jgi:hypothetical protein
MINVEQRARESAGASIAALYRMVICGRRQAGVSAQAEGRFIDRQTPGRS